VASLTRPFVSAKRLFRDLAEFNSKLVELRAQSPIGKFKILVVRLSIAGVFPTAPSRVHLYNKYDKYLYLKYTFLSTEILEWERLPLLLVWALFFLPILFTR